MAELHPIPMRTPEKVELLAIRGNFRDRLALQSILLHTNWLVHWVADEREAMLFLEDHPVPVVICPEEIPDGSWSDLLSGAQELANAPKVLIYSDRDDPAFGNEVISAGAYDLLSMPLQRDEVLRAIRLAFRRWREEIRHPQVLTAGMTA